MNPIGREYRPNGAIGEPLLLLAGAGAAIVAAILVGALMSLVGQWLYLVLLFPLLEGALIGAVGRQVVRLAKVRHPTVAALPLLIAGLVGYVAYQYTDYLFVLRDMRQELTQEGMTEPVLQDQMIQEIFVEKQGVGGFAGFLLQSAEVGTSITSTHSSKESGIPIQGVVWWIYVGVEALIVAFIAALIAWSAATEPFCEACGLWMAKPVPVLRADAAREEELKKLAHEGGLKTLASAPRALDAPLPALELAIRPCRRCTRTGYADLNLLTLDAKNKLQRKSVLAQIRLPDGDGAALLPKPA